MPKQTTTKKTDAPVTTTPAKTAAPAKTVVKKEKPAPAPVAAPAPTPVPVETAPEVTPEVTTTVMATEFLAKLNSLSSMVASLKADYKLLEKKQTRELKLSQKASSKHKRKNGNRKPSGFIKPTLISNELAEFLQKPVGTEMARTEVTREINMYIKTHNLQDKENGRNINPDAKLTALLKLTSADKLTYFNLQRYMSSHFPKPAAEVKAK